jgi:hypothetical protein
MRLNDFEARICYDFEFEQRPGSSPRPIALVGTEICSGRWWRYFWDELPATSPFPKDALHVGYAITAEHNCFLALGWELPRYCIDLFAEYRLHTNEICNKFNLKFLSALDHFGISHISSQHKAKIRERCARGFPFSVEERQPILDYCTSDVGPQPELLETLVGGMDDRQFEQALARGRFTTACAHVEQIGIPLDMPKYNELKLKWDHVLLAMIHEIDRNFHVYDGIHFKLDRFDDYLSQQRIPWPKTPTGRLKIDDETFRSMSDAHPILQPLRELRRTLHTMKHWQLPVDDDGRNRTGLKPFCTQTARCAPSNSESLFGTARWLRGLGKPPAGYGFNYDDFDQEEFGIAMWLARDANGIEAYQAGDVYLEFGRQCNAIPRDGTKESHRLIRDRYKQVVLAVGYGQQARGLSQRLGSTESQAQALLDQHRKIYNKFWDWKDRVLATMKLTGEISTCTGWRIKKTGKLSAHQERSVQNFLVQSTASSILHVCTPMVIDAGIQIAMLVHDALLTISLLNKFKEHGEIVREIMVEASKQVLGGFALRVGVEPYVDRYMDEKGKDTWDLVMRLLKQCDPPPVQYQLYDPEGAEIEVTHTW